MQTQIKGYKECQSASDLYKEEMIMQEFILEEQIDKVTNNNTKKYIMEVVSSYNNGNYRAAVVVLYTTVIYDLLQKLVALKEVYNDEGAKKILDSIKKEQKSNPQRSEWENTLIEKIYSETKIISAVEKEELLYLKKERNYAAHPIINLDDINEQLELKIITKETAKDMIRKAFEIVFLKDAILAKNIFEDFLADLNEFYARVKIDGLEKYLNTKYFCRMTQERKDSLFRSMWKIVFLINNDDCNQNRASNYYGLFFLYNENKNHYRELIKNDEDYYFNKFEIETIESWSGISSKEIELYSIVNFNWMSRIIYFVNFLKYFPEIYKDLNDYGKNILEQSINHMYINDDILDKSLYQTACQNKDLFKEQVKIKSNAVFMSQSIEQHFEMIFKMILNYEKIQNDWIDSSHYNVLDAGDLEQIFYQSEQRGCTEQFIKFLIDYCIGANTYMQAQQMFDYLKQFKKIFKEEHYYMILAKMNNNSQYYNNNKKADFIEEIEVMYSDSFNAKLIKEKEEKYLYNKLYNFSQIEDYDIKRILALIEERAEYYSAWSLQSLIFELEDIHNFDFLKKEKLSSYGNILKVLANKDDPNYNLIKLEKFKGYFV